jgi:uncharacterized membrane protein YecN with MAPEG domain
MITSIYCSLIALMLIALSINVIKGRRKFSAGLGDANNIEIIRRIRAQSNLTEYSPIFIILLGFAEHLDFPSFLIHAFGLTFLVGRVMHAYSLLKDEKYDDQNKLTKKPIWRIRGMMCTFGTIGILALAVFANNLLQLFF